MVYNKIKMVITEDNMRRLYEKIMEIIRPLIQSQKMITALEIRATLVFSHLYALSYSLCF